MSIQRRGDAGFQALLNTGANIKAACEAAYPDVDYTYLIKDRANANNWQMLDTVRGSNAVLQTNAAAAETTYSAPSGNSVGYVWRRGAAFGHDVVLDAGAGSAKTVAHALGATPHFMMRVSRTNGGRLWGVYHRNMNATPQNGYLDLRGTSAYTADGTFWNSTAPTSGVFSVGTYLAANAENFVTHLWTSIPGFSLFGSYVGNGSADGRFVWCGFRPRFVLVKRADATGDWYIHDAARSPSNVMGNLLSPNGSGVEFNTGTRLLDFTASGFKFRSSDFDVNASGNTYIFAAFAEVPFKFATAR